MELAGIHPWLRMVRSGIPHQRQLDLAAMLPVMAVSTTQSADAALLPSLTNTELEKWRDPALDKCIDSDLKYLEQLNCTPVTINCADYPARLRQIVKPPLLLLVRGNVEILAADQIAVVGSRNASHLGLETARDFASRLCEAGFAITSGLALGVDAAAHRGCLDVSGKTIGVAATGPERIYPATHAPLARRIIESGGALITEFLPREPPRAQNFPRRNRIISGLSLGTLVVEAALRSGSLITARYALEQDREVFAIPGSIHNPASRGCHHLIRQGAKLVEQVEDIFEELQWSRTRPCAGESAPSETSAPNTPDQIAEHVLAAVDFGPTDIDTVVRRAGLAVQVVSTSLLELELRGLVCKSAGFFSRRAVAR
jgi:DNA processing protein